jgi:hypothetical protein
MVVMGNGNVSSITSVARSVARYSNYKWYPNQKLKCLITTTVIRQGTVLIEHNLHFFPWGLHSKLQPTHAHNTNTHKIDNIQEVEMCH